MVCSLEDHREYLHQHGIKSTRPRNLVWEILLTHDGILSAEEIYQTVVQQGETVNFSTIYRVLELFVEKGLVEKSFFPGTQKNVFSVCHVGHTHHLICLRCHKTVDISPCPLSDLEKQIAAKTDFQIVGHHLEIYGYCPECRKIMK
ncbi:MAG: transcriptional repressor [Megasphaera sp.]|jgi:Fur family ferric uptake transcriptional regulator|uniref:Fur family transcriptional regulator n=1 Tax=Megasphaera sueciensis TaxID=349094 RepID=UPI003CFE80BA|nr:transcriptional repressor [Megasphaera sp.]MCI1822543.1 transcriptional repressor [Megasphaera sp.]